MNSNRSKLESFIFADLMVTVMFAVLAYGTVEAWSLALFELNALLLAVLLSIRFTFDDQAEFKNWRLALPLLAITGWGAIQVAASISRDRLAT